MSVKSYAAAAWLLCASAPAFAAPTSAQMAEKIDTLPYFANDLGGGYKISEHAVMRDLPADAVEAGIKASAGFLVEKPSGLYRTALISYMFFGDTAHANAFFQKMLTGSDGRIIAHYQNFKLGKQPPGSKLGSEVRLTCTAVEQNGFALGCSFYEASIPAVVVIVMSPGVDPAERRNGEPEVETAWRVAPPKDNFAAIMTGVVEQLAQTSAD